MKNYQAQSIFTASQTNIADQWHRNDDNDVIVFPLETSTLLNTDPTKNQKYNLSVPS